jgi:N6-adenosine-specific RNA methylase IME4
MLFTTEKIYRLKIPQLMKDDVLLFQWVTVSKIETAKFNKIFSLN